MMKWTSLCMTCGLWSLMAVMLLAVAGAQDVPCGQRESEIVGCLEHGYVEYDQLARGKYRHEMCRQLQGVAMCVSSHRADCPNIPTFRGRTGRAVDQFLSSYAGHCSGGGGEAGGVSRSDGEGQCVGSKRRFCRKLGRCNSAMEVRLSEDQMCGAMRNVSRCMARQLRKNLACDWMSDTVARQVQLGVDFLNVIRAIEHDC